MTRKASVSNSNQKRQLRRSGTTVLMDDATKVKLKWNK
jgi:hypothetical protein